MQKPLHESIPTPDNTLNGAIREKFGIFVRPIDPFHRLVREDHADQIREFYSDALNKRFIVMPNSPQVAEQHRELESKGLNVFNASFSEKLAILLVPSGAQQLTSLLPAFSRNPEHQPILKATGKFLRKMDDLDVGLPMAEPDRPTLDQIAFATDEETSEGGKIYLVPPYSLEAVSPNDAFENIRAEINNTGSIDPSTTDALLDALNEGWHEYSD